MSDPSIAPPQVPEGFHPPGTPAPMLDNPPRTRPMSASPPISQDPFSGLSMVDVLNIRFAMEERFNALTAEGTQANPTHLLSTKRLLDLAIAKLSPPPPNAGLIKMAVPTIPPTRLVLPPKG